MCPQFEMDDHEADCPHATVTRGEPHRAKLQRQLPVSYLTLHCVYGFNCPGTANKFHLRDRPFNNITVRDINSVGLCQDWGMYQRTTLSTLYIVRLHVSLILLKEFVHRSAVDTRL